MKPTPTGENHLRIRRQKVPCAQHARTKQMINLRCAQVVESGISEGVDELQLRPHS